MSNFLTAQTVFWAFIWATREFDTAEAGVVRFAVGVALLAMVVWTGNRRVCSPD